MIKLLIKKRLREETLTLIFTSANLKLNKFQAEFNISMELNL